MEDLEILRQKIENLENFHQIEIFKIIDKNNILYTENRNGVFVNMAQLNKIVISEIKKYITYVYKQNSQLESTEQIKNSYKRIYFDKDNKEISTNMVI